MNIPYIPPAELAEATGDYGAISFRTPYGDECRKRDAIQVVKDRYWVLKNRLANRMQDEIRRIEREGA
jgi:hypothetical protein